MALVMAGGQGTRMRASGADLPKPLVPVAGAPLLERALFPVLRSGVTEIVVSVPGTIPAIGAFAAGRLTELAEAAGGTVEVYEEQRALGNIGCAAALAGRAERVLVVYADNVTSLDLTALLEEHTRRDAPVTVAVHEHRHRLPYGRLTLDGSGDVTAYEEKPELRSLVCSAVTVLDAAALAVLAAHVGDPPGRAAGLVDLFGLVRDSGFRVAAQVHDAPWADVNDAGSIDAAEAVLRGDPTAAETWWSEPIEPEVRSLPAPTSGAVAVDPPGTLPGGVLVDDVRDGRPVRYRVLGSGAAPVAPPNVAARAAAHLFPDRGPG